MGTTQQKFTCDDNAMEKTYLWGQHNGNLLVKDLPGGMMLTET